MKPVVPILSIVARHLRPDGRDASPLLTQRRRARRDARRPNATPEKTTGRWPPQPSSPGIGHRHSAALRALRGSALSRSRPNGERCGRCPSAGRLESLGFEATSTSHPVHLVYPVKRSFGSALRHEVLFCRMSLYFRLQVSSFKITPYRGPSRQCWHET